MQEFIFAALPIIDFDEEDPLRDLLSSSGENTPVKKVPKKLSAQESNSDLTKQQSKSKRIADIFGLNEQEVIFLKSSFFFFKERNCHKYFCFFLPGSQH